MGKVLGKKRRKYTHLMGVAILLLSTSLFYATAQYYKSELKAPSPSQTVAPKDDNSSKKQSNDDQNQGLHYPIKQAAPQSYEELLNPQETPIDLKQPKNIESHAEYDPITRTYVIRTKVGDREIVTPFVLSEKQYNDWQTREAMQEYYWNVRKTTPGSDSGMKSMRTASKPVPW